MKRKSTTKISLFKGNYIKIIQSFCFLFILTNHSIGQNNEEYYYNEGIGASNPNSQNINHPNVTILQDIKRSSCFFLNTQTNNSACSCNLINNANQEKIPYISTAAHCVDPLELNKFYESYFSFDYELEHATKRGSPIEDKLISKLYLTEFEIVFKDNISDFALIKLKSPYPAELLENAYAAGWDTMLNTSLWSNISHPVNDHKKVFAINRKQNLGFLNYRIMLSFRGFSVNFSDNSENLMEGGTSGSGFFSIDNHLKSIMSFSHVHKVFTSLLLNNWQELKADGYGKNIKTTHLSEFLDSKNTWLNSIPGGYYNDLIALDTNENFKLTINPLEVLSTPSTELNNPTKLDPNTIMINPSILFKDLKKNNQNGYEATNFPVWVKTLGVRASNFNNSDVVLSVYFLNKELNTGLYTERLLFGTFANESSTINYPNELNFKGDSWSCDNSPLNFQPCNRFPTGLFTVSQGSSHDFKKEYLESIKYLRGSLKKGDFRGLDDLTEIPVRIELKNLSSNEVTIEAIAYPGEVPRNALQLFKPNEVALKFKSKKYHSSFGISSDELFINSLRLSQENGINKTITTDNNGGYLNMVNRNFKFEKIVPSHTNANGNEVIKQLNFEIELKNTTMKPTHYKIWIDYNPQVDDQYYYNFSQDKNPNLLSELELVAFGQMESTNEITVIKKTVNLPSNIDLDILPGNKKSYRMRVAISSEDNIAQDGNYQYGDVEDYLIEIDLTSTDTSNRLTKNTQKQESTNLVVYPNPTKGPLNIIADVRAAGDLVIKIIDLTGKELFVKEYNNMSVGHFLFSLGETHLATGIYIIKVSCNGHEQTEKLVVEQ